MLVRRANTNYRRAQALGYDRRGSGEPLDSRAGRQWLSAMDSRGSACCSLLSSHVACCDARLAGNAARPAACTAVAGKRPTAGLQLASSAGCHRRAALLPQDGSCCLLRSSQPNHSPHVTCRRLRAGQGVRATTTWAGEAPTPHRAASGTTRWWRIGCDPPLPARRGTPQIEALSLQVSLSPEQLLGYHQGRHEASSIRASSRNALHHKTTTAFHQDMPSKAAARERPLLSTSACIWGADLFDSCRAALRACVAPTCQGHALRAPLHITTAFYTFNCAHASCKFLMCRS